MPTDSVCVWSVPARPRWYWMWLPIPLRECRVWGNNAVRFCIPRSRENGDQPAFHRQGRSGHGNFTVAVWVGNFDGTPMAAVSGISGAGPLLRRIVLRTAKRMHPGVLPSRHARRNTRTVCRVRQRAVPECRPSMVVPAWHHPPADEKLVPEGALVLPARLCRLARSAVAVWWEDGERVAATGNTIDA